jgi:ribosome-associated toxin RatA of RatAB toxin-antitoxin module
VITLEASRAINAPAEEVWKAISDVGAYANVTKSLSRSEILSGEGLGMRRRCHDQGGRSWEETCTLWEEGSRYRFEVDTASYPLRLRLLLRSLEGTWAIEPIDRRSKVSMRFDADFRLGPLGRALGRLMRRSAKAECEHILAQWQLSVESPQSGEDGYRDTRRLGRAL